MSSVAKHLVAAFYLPTSSVGPKIFDLLQQMGASKILAQTEQRASCWWANMPCLSYVTNLQFHNVIELWFPHSDFMRSRDLENAEGVAEIQIEARNVGVLPASFKKSCEELFPDVAFVVSHPWQANTEFIYSVEWMVLAKAANALADERLGLLYLCNEILDYWTPNTVRDNRDSILSQSGRFFFAGSVPNRWA